MNPFRIHTGLVAPLYRQNIDTDQIIPKQFLKRVERTGFGQYLFYDWRFSAQHELDQSFALNDKKYAGATVLIAGRNFGCGSSREHAPWALTDYGFRAIIASSFADIFNSNSLKNGLLPVVLREELVAELARRATENEHYELTVDLENLVVKDAHGFNEPFQLDAFRRDCMLKGLDDIGLTLRYAEDINSFEKARPMWKPSLLSVAKS